MDVCAHSGKPKTPQKETCSKHYWEDVYKAFKSDPDNRGLSQSTMQERYLRLGTVFRLMDLKNVEDISVETVRNLRRKLMEYPVNCRKLYPKLSPEEAIRQGKAGANVRLFDCSKNGRVLQKKTKCRPRRKRGLTKTNDNGAECCYRENADDLTLRRARKTALGIWSAQDEQEYVETMRTFSETMKG